MKFILNKKRPVVYFGRVTESKGIGLVIQAMYLLYKRGLPCLSPLWILGGNYVEINEFKKREELADIIMEMEQNNLLFWWGQIPHNNLPIILSKCSLFCFASKYEPGGRTILEAMACKLPVLATPQGFAPEIIENGVNGFIIKDGTPKDWAEKIIYILSDSKLAEKMGKEAQNTIIKSFTMKHFFLLHWDIYERFNPK